MSEKFCLGVDIRCLQFRLISLDTSGTREGQLFLIIACKYFIPSIKLPTLHQVVRCYLSMSDLSLINHWLYRSHRWLRVMCHAPPSSGWSESWFYPTNIISLRGVGAKLPVPARTPTLTSIFKWVFRPIFSDHSDQQQKNEELCCNFWWTVFAKKKNGEKNMHEDSKTVILRQKLPTEERFRLPVGASGLSVAGHVFSHLLSSSRLFENSFFFLLERREKT